MSAEDSELLTYTITLPPSTVWDSRRAQQLIDQLLFAFQALIFRIVATAEQITWQVVDPLGRDPSALTTAIRSTYPEARVTVLPYDRHEGAGANLSRYVIKYQYKHSVFLAPIHYVTDIAVPDPLAIVTEAMSALQPGERILYTLIVDGSAQEAYKQGEKHLNRPVYDGSLWHLLFPYKIDRYIPELQRVMRAKLQERLYHAALLIQIDTPQAERLNTLLTIDNHLVSFDRPLFNGVHWIDDHTGVVQITSSATEWESSAIGLFVNLTGEPRLNAAKRKLQQAMQLILEPREIASLWHLPHAAFTAPTIAWTHPQVRLPPRLVGQRQGVCLGENQFAGRTEPIYLPDRTGHVSIIGKAGVGKSNLLHHLIHQDIAQNRGVAVIDPHGQLIRELLQSSIPPHRE